MTDKLATTVVKSMDDMSSMHPSESIISTGLFSFSFSLSFQLPHVTPSVLSFMTSMYRDRMDAEIETPSPCTLSGIAYTCLEDAKVNDKVVTVREGVVRGNSKGMIDIPLYILLEMR